MKTNRELERLISNKEFSLISSVNYLLAIPFTKIAMLLQLQEIWSCVKSQSLYLRKECQWFKCSNAQINVLNFTAAAHLLLLHLSSLTLSFSLRHFVYQNNGVKMHFKELMTIAILLRTNSYQIASNTYTLNGLFLGQSPFHFVGKKVWG